MLTRRRVLLACAFLAGLAAVPVLSTGARVAPADLPARLPDQEFWRIVTEFSEPDGYFDSDNLVSNEDTYQTVIPSLVRAVPAGGAYLGVGPDQNFAYILAVQPRLSFITDVRRGNLRVHLMYKALIELSADRAEFVSRLFSRPRPPGIGADSSAQELFGAYAGAPPDRALFEDNLRALMRRLTVDHSFSLLPGDEAGIASAYSNFFAAGPGLRFVSSRPGNRYPSYEVLQLATDDAGVEWGYLSTEERFGRLRAAQGANAIVPIVGNFGGPKALRSVAAYLTSHGATVGVFYTSNVERYLFQDGLWGRFVANVRAMPLGQTSTFVRSCFDTCSGLGDSRSVSLLEPIGGLLGDVAAGRVTGYYDVLNHSRGR